jgi:large subunit ribosomal protein L31
MVDTLVLETSTYGVEVRVFSWAPYFPNIFIFLLRIKRTSKTKYSMKEKIHPKSKMVQVMCSCGNTMELLSTIKGEEIRVEICSKCHPHYTGEQRILKTGAVDKFYARQKKMEELQAKK